MTDFTYGMRHSQWMCLRYDSFLLVVAMVAEAPCQRMLADLFTFVSWRVHEISSVCAEQTANSVALQISRRYRYRPPCPLRLLLQVSCAAGNSTHTNMDSHRNRQGLMEVVKTTQTMH